MARPKLIAVSPRPLGPIHDGLALRINYMLETLCSEWDILLVTGYDEGEKVLHFSNPSVAAKQQVSVPLNGRWRTHPSQYSTGPLVDAVTSLVNREKPDVALLWPGAEFLTWTIPDFPPAVADRIDCLALTYRRARGKPSKMLDRLRMIRDLVSVMIYERRITNTAAATTVVGEADATELRRLSRSNRVHVVPNGVSIFPGDVQRAMVPTVAFTGVLDYAPNINAAVYLANQIWPAVLAALPDAQLVIAGRKPTAAIKGLADLPNVTVLADVDRMEHVLRTAWVAATPMLDGAGIKNKVLEAWACGTPVVMSPMATNGLRLPRGHEALVAQEASAFSCILIEMLGSKAHCTAMGNDAYHHVRTNYTWAQAGKSLSSILYQARARSTNERATSSSSTSTQL